jgi:CRP-like cAMP-binding protein
MLISDAKKEWLKKEFLTKIDFLKEIPENEIIQLIDSLERITYNKGQTIIFQGEISNRLYLISEGKVSVWIKQGKEKKQVALLGQGEYFGEMSLLEPITASATLRAEEQCELFTLSREKLISVTNKFPKSIDKIREKILKRKEELGKNRSENV